MALALPVAGLADAAVWRVSGGDATVFLGGTVHKLSPQQYPLPREFRAAYDRADIVVFETDIEAMQSPGVRARIAERSMLAGGDTLQSILAPATYRALEAYCEETGFPIERLAPLKAVPAMLTLLTVALHEIGITAPGVDEHFYRRAQSESKAIQALETADEQIDYLLSLDQDDPDTFVTRSIEDLRDARRGGLADSLRVWREGDENGLIEQFLEDQVLYSPDMYQTLLVDRNREWMHALRRYMETPETELVLVGVAHMIGADGLVALLRHEGYDVEKYSVQ